MPKMLKKTNNRMSFDIMVIVQGTFHMSCLLLNEASTIFLNINFFLAALKQSSSFLYKVFTPSPPSPLF